MAIDVKTCTLEEASNEFARKIEVVINKYNKTHSDKLKLAVNMKPNNIAKMFYFSTKGSEGKPFLQVVLYPKDVFSVYLLNEDMVVEFTTHFKQFEDLIRFVINEITSSERNSSLLGKEELEEAA